MPVAAATNTPPLGVVLAGGQSRRMGVDKATLAIDGETLLLRARRILLAAGCGEVLLSGPARAEWPERRVADTFAAAGPVAGIVAALRVAQDAQRIVFVAVDTPLLQPQTLRRLLASTASASLFDDSPLPLALTLSTEVRAGSELAERRLRAGESCSIRSLLAALAVERIALDENELQQLRNVNTPDEWRQINDELAH